MCEIEEGDLIAIQNTGAYGYSMSSNFLSRLRPAEILIKGNEITLIRDREIFDDLIRRII